MCDIKGQPLMDTTVTAENKLWWPMSEALYATILAYETTKEDIYLEWCSKIWNYIEAHFIDSENGGDWWGYLRRDGTVFNKLKGRDPPTWSAPTSKKLENIDRSVNPWSKVEITKAAFTFPERFFSRSYRLPASLSLKNICSGPSEVRPRSPDLRYTFVQQNKVHFIVIILDFGNLQRLK